MGTSWSNVTADEPCGIQGETEDPETSNPQSRRRSAGDSFHGHESDESDTFLEPLPHEADCYSLPRTDVRRFLIHAAQDPVTGLPLGPSSLALRYLLPVRDLNKHIRSQRRQHVAPFMESLHQALGGWDKRPVQGLTTGSSAEGLCVPPFSRRMNYKDVLTPPEPPSGDPVDEEVRGLLFLVEADTDIMLELPHLPVYPGHGGGPLYLEYGRSSHPGYVRVVVDPQLRSELHEIAEAICVTEKYSSRRAGERSEQVEYLSSDAIMQLLPRFREGELPGQNIIERHGPSMNLQKLLKIACVDVDGVPALPLAEPLDELRLWRNRLKSSGAAWPARNVRKRIMKRYCGHLVPTGHPKSKRRHLEWRMSFSMPEKALAHSLTDVQRKVYILTKLMQKGYLNKPKMLVTYHIKTLMFWELEQSKGDWTEEHLFARLMDVLDRLSSCLESRCIPSYFVPENNLISSFPGSDVRKVADTISTIRQHPLKFLFDMDRRWRFQFSGVLPLHRQLARLLETVSANKLHKVPAALAKSLAIQARVAVSRDKHAIPRSAELLRDAWEVEQPPDTRQLPFHFWLVFATLALFAGIRNDEDVWIRDVLLNTPRSAGASGAAEVAETGECPDREDVANQWVELCKEVGPFSPFVDLINTYLEAHGEDLDRAWITDTLYVFIFSGPRRIPMSAQETLQSVKQIALREQASSEGVVAATWGRMSGDLDARWQELQRTVPDLVDGTQLIAANQAMLTISDWTLQEGDEKTIFMNAVLQQYQTGHSHTADGATSGDPVLTQEQVNLNYTPILDIIGLLVQSNHDILAARVANWMTHLSLRHDQMDKQKPVQATYSLHRARHWMACLPPALRSLLKLTSGRVGFITLNELVVLGVPLLTGNPLFLPLLHGVPLFSDRYTGGEQVPDDVLLTDAVVRLALLKLAGGSPEECLDCLSHVVHQVQAQQPEIERLMLRL